MAAPLGGVRSKKQIKELNNSCSTSEIGSNTGRGSPSYGSNVLQDIDKTELKQFTCHSAHNVTGHIWVA